MDCSVPFYHCSKEDQKAFELLQQKKIESGGIVEKCDIGEEIFRITPDIYGVVDQIYEREIAHLGRNRKVPLDIRVSVKEIGEATRKASPHKKFKIIFRGGGIWKALKPLVERVFKKWKDSSFPASYSLLTPSLLQTFEVDPPDYDFAFYSFAKTVKLNKQVVEAGIEKLLTKKFREKKVPPPLLVKELVLYKKKKRLSAYAEEIFKQFPTLDSLDLNDPIIHMIFIKIFGFLQAENVSDATTQTYFSQRKIGDGKTTDYDCIFSHVVPSTTTPINSLYIKIPKNGWGSSSNYLKSSLGPLARLQAISDKNLNILTFGSSESFNRSQFVRTISFFTLKGRCYQKKLKEILNEFENEIKKQSKPLSEVLSKELIACLRGHHHNEPALLIALAFNASAIILWLNPQHKSEIQKLWGLIFDYLDNIEEAYSHLMSHPMIEMIQILMRDPLFNFEDLLFQIQISSAIDHHCVPNKEKKYISHPTQTDGHIFIQITLKIDQRKLKNNRTTFSLFFPYTLLQEIQRLKNRPPSSLEVVNSLNHFNEALLAIDSLSFGFGQSPLIEYADDPRRQNGRCQEALSQVLENKSEYSWLMAYLLSLSFLAQNYDPHQIKKVIKNFLNMLKESWASTKLRKTAITVLYNTLAHNGISLNPIFAADSSPPSFSLYDQWIRSFVDARWEPLTDIALELLDEIELFIKGGPERKNFYKSLIGHSLKDSDQINRKFLSSLIARIANDTRFNAVTKLEWLHEIYIHPSFSTLRKTESESFLSHLIPILESLKGGEVPKKKKNEIMDFIIRLFEQNVLSEQPFKALSVLKNIFRLKLLPNKEYLQKIWDHIVSFIPQSTEMAVLFQEECLATAKEYKYWPAISEEKQDSFTKQLAENIKKYVESTGNLQKLPLDDVSSIFGEKQKKDLWNSLTPLFHKLLEKENDSFSLLDVDFLLIHLRYILKQNKEVSVTEEIFVFNVLDKLSQLKIGVQFINEIKSIIKLYLYPNDLKNRNLGLAKASGFDLPESTPYYNMGSIPEVESRELSLKPKTDFSSCLGIDTQNDVSRWAASFLDLMKKLRRSVQDGGFTKLFYLAYLDSFFPLFTDGVITCSLYGELAALLMPDGNRISVEELQPVFKKHGEKLFSHLYRYNLWREVIELYFLTFPHSFDLAEHPVEMLEACAHYIQEEPADFSFVSRIDSLIETLSPITRKQLSRKINFVYDKLFYSKGENYLEGLEILKKKGKYSDLLDSSFYNDFFQTSSFLIPQGHVQEVYQALLSLDTPCGYELWWRDILQLLLVQRQFKACHTLIERKFIYMETPEKDFEPEWISFLELVMSYAEGLQKYNSKLAQEYLKISHKIIRFFIGHYQLSRDDLWERYIHLSAKSASITTVEELLRKMGSEHFKALLDSRRRIGCWKAILKRFTKTSSLKILDIDTWLGSAFREFESDKKSEGLNEILSYFVSATLKSIEKNKKYSTAIVDKIKKIADVFYDLTLVPYLLGFENTEIFINLAKIFIIVPEAKYLLKSLYCLTIIFTMIRWDPILETKAIKLMDSCARNAVKYKNSKEYKDVLLDMDVLIDLALHSPQIENGNLFCILQYLHDIEEPQEKNGSKARGVNLYEKLKVLKKIFNNPWKELGSDFTDKDRELVTKTFHQFYECPLIPFVEFSQESLRKKGFRHCVDMSSSLKRKLGALELTKIGIIERRFVEIVKDMLALKRGVNRYVAFRLMGFAKNFHLLHEEKQMFKKYGMTCVKLLSITLLFYTAMNIYESQFSNENPN